MSSETPPADPPAALHNARGYLSEGRFWKVIRTLPHSVVASLSEDSLAEALLIRGEAKLALKIVGEPVLKPSKPTKPDEPPANTDPVNKGAIEDLNCALAHMTGDDPRIKRANALLGDAYRFYAWEIDPSCSQKAIDHFQAALSGEDEATPLDSWVNAHLGAVYFLRWMSQAEKPEEQPQTSDIDAAEGKLDNALAARPSYAWAWRGLGAVKIAKVISGGKLDAAVQALGNALLNDPRQYLYVNAGLSLTYLLAAQNSPPKSAQSLFEKCISTSARVVAADAENMNAIFTMAVGAAQLFSLNKSDSNNIDTETIASLLTSSRNKLTRTRERADAFINVIDNYLKSIQLGNDTALKTVPAKHFEDPERAFILSSLGFVAE